MQLQGAAVRSVRFIQNIRNIQIINRNINRIGIRWRYVFFIFLTYIFFVRLNVFGLLFISTSLNAVCTDCVVRRDACPQRMDVCVVRRDACSPLPLPLHGLRRAS